MNQKRLFTEPFLFYAFVQAEDDTEYYYYTYDFILFNKEYDDKYIIENEYIFAREWWLGKSIYKYFDEKTIDYINRMAYDYEHLYNIFILIPEIMRLTELSDIIKNNLDIKQYFKIRCDA